MHSNSRTTSDRSEDLLRDVEKPQTGVAIHELGTERRVLVKAMEDEPRVDLLKVFWAGAEVEEGSDSGEGSCRRRTKKKTKRGWEMFEPKVSRPLRMEHRCSEAAEICKFQVF